MTWGKSLSVSYNTFPWALYPDTDTVKRTRKAANDKVFIIYVIIILYKY
jgi:hypothetical protein